jgi:hypothetical protein
MEVQALGGSGERCLSGSALDNHTGARNLREATADFATPGMVFLDAISIKYISGYRENAVNIRPSRSEALGGVCRENRVFGNCAGHNTQDVV